jgi:hypothetical protein
MFQGFYSYMKYKFFTVWNADCVCKISYILNNCYLFIIGKIVYCVQNSPYMVCLQNVHMIE